MRTDGSTREAPFFRGVWALIDISWITKPGWKHPVMTVLAVVSIRITQNSIRFTVHTSPSFFQCWHSDQPNGSFLRPLPSSALHPIQSQWMNFAYNERCITTGERSPRRADELCRIAQKSMFRNCCCVYFKWGLTFSIYNVCSQPSILQLLLILGCDFGCCFCLLLLLLIPWIRLNFQKLIPLSCWG